MDNRIDTPIPTYPGVFQRPIKKADILLKNGARKALNLDDYPEAIKLLTELIERNTLSVGDRVMLIRHDMDGNTIVVEAGKVGTLLVDGTQKALVEFDGVDALVKVKKSDLIKYHEKVE